MQAVLRERCECWNQDGQQCVSEALVLLMLPDEPDTKLYSCIPHARIVNQFWAADA